MLAIEALAPLFAQGTWVGAHGLRLGVTVVSASLPVIGAAVCGIRTQGDFAGAAERNAPAGDASCLASLDRRGRGARVRGLSRLIRRTAKLLTADVSQWVRATQAWPLRLLG